MAGCWPRCFGGGRKKKPQESWKNTQPMKGATVKKKQPLSDFFKPAELQVPGQPAHVQRRVCPSDVAQGRLLRAQFHNQLPSVRQDQAPTSQKLRGKRLTGRVDGRSWVSLRTACWSCWTTRSHPRCTARRASRTASP